MAKEQKYEKEGKAIFYSGRKDGRHGNGVRFIVSEDTFKRIHGSKRPNMLYATNRHF